MENKELYGVVLLRTDGDHILVTETDSYDAAYAKWKTLHEYWVVCLHEKKPFILESPVVTAFDPARVFEISLRPTATTNTTQEKSNNPYKRDMLAKGFSNTFGKYTNTNDRLLDEGYK